VTPSGTAQEVTVGGRRLRLSNLDKVFYAATGFTKGQVIDYYARVGPTVVPHLKGRALTMKRYPDGAGGPYFYEKRCPSHRPDWVHTAPIWSGRNAGLVEYCVIDDLPSLVWGANLANLELHASLGYGDRIDCPTMLMFDLDPGEGVGLLESARVAFLVRDLLGSQGLELVAKTSGGKGIQVAAPLNIETSYDETKPLAQAVAETLEKQAPDLVVSRMTRSLRQKRVLIDWSQNTASKTTVLAYSLRAGEVPRVSTPVTFDELDEAVEVGDPERLRFGPDEVLDRVDRLGDLWAPTLELRQEVPEALRRRG
jgi:bifunctional non-homologous end joining protein LigD